MYSSLINKNEEMLKDAINNGINNETVYYTLNRLVEKNDRTGKIPKQLPKVLAGIVYMKKMVKVPDTEQYYSSVVKNNSERIKDALKNGISPDEIAISLIDTINSPSKNSKKRLKFMVKLISKMKTKEKRLQRQNENNKGYQKVYINN